MQCSTVWSSSAPNAQNPHYGRPAVVRVHFVGPSGLCTDQYAPPAGVAQPLGVSRHRGAVGEYVVGKDPTWWEMLDDLGIVALRPHP